tara:strand:+ start:202 stop:507 length:306 start_codon:yes stop_codon:yes gene_type:complete
MSGLADLFRAEIVLTQRIDRGVREHVFNVNDIKQYYNLYAEGEATEAAREKGENLSYVYYTYDGDYSAGRFQEDICEIKKRIKGAEDERISRIQKARLQII